MVPKVRKKRESVREREKLRESEKSACVCVSEREREREIKRFSHYAEKASETKRVKMFVMKRRWMKLR